MKVTTNFAAPIQRLTPPLAAALWGLGLVFVVAAIWLAADAVGLRRENAALRERLAQLETKQPRAVSPVALPPLAEMNALRQRVATVNTLSGVRGRPVTALLADLEDLLPDQAYLVSLHHKAREGEALLVAEAYSAETLTAFLLKLEKDQRLAEALLVLQATRDARGGRAVQFEIRIKERP